MTDVDYVSMQSLVSPQVCVPMVLSVEWLMMLTINVSVLLARCVLEIVLVHLAPMTQTWINGICVKVCCTILCDLCSIYENITWGRAWVRG